MSHRLQVIVTDQQYEALNELANRTRISIAEHVRTFIDRELRPHARPNRNGVALSLALTRRPDEPFQSRRPGIRLVD